MRPDHRYVEAHVVPILGHLYDDRTASAQPACALQGRVRPLEGLHGKDGSLLDHHGLANVECAGCPGHVEPETEVHLFSLGRGTARQQPGFRHVVLHERGGRNEVDPQPLQFFRHRSEDRLRIADGQSLEQVQHAPVEPEVEEMGGSDLARHDGVAYAAGLERVQHKAELAEGYPAYLVRGAIDARVRFPSERDGEDMFDAASLRRFGEESRVRAFSRDDCNGFGVGGLHGGTIGDGLKRHQPANTRLAPEWKGTPAVSLRSVALRSCRSARQLRALRRCTRSTWALRGVRW